MGSHGGFFKGEKKKKKKGNITQYQGGTPAWQLPQVEIIGKNKRKSS